MQHKKVVMQMTRAQTRIWICGLLVLTGSQMTVASAAPTRAAETLLTDADTGAVTQERRRGGPRGGGNPPRPNPQPQPQPEPNPQPQPGPGPQPEPDPQPGPQPGPEQPEDLDARLRALIQERGLNVDPAAGRNLPTVDDPVVQLGKALFFAKNLGGENDSSCASCHHPTLGGADALSLPVGVDAVNANDVARPDLLGHGRFHDNQDGNRPIIGRNSPTVFNVSLMDRGMFWDSRVETRRSTPGSNGAGDVIVTPDSPVNEQGRRLRDPNLPAGVNLPAAQARFPVTSDSEMRGSFAAGSDNQSLRAQLAARFDNSNNDYQTGWPILFGQAYPDGEVNFDRIAEAIGEYERSMTFVNNPWRAYMAGDDSALNEDQKAGALLFFNPRGQGGAGCVACHNGPTLSDGRHHLTAFPQIGPGAGDDSGQGPTDDFGREKVTGNERDRYHFRTPPLLNIAVTAPYGHSGAYQTLEQVVRHYDNPRASVDRLFGVQNGQAFANGGAPLCDSPQMAGLIAKNNLECGEVFPAAFANSTAALDRLQAARANPDLARAPLRRNARLNNNEVRQLVAFLGALTDPCVLDRDCLNPWIVDEDERATYPDDNPLMATDQQGDAL